MIAFNDQPPIVKAQGLLKSKFDDLADNIAEVMIHRPGLEKCGRWQAVQGIVQNLKTVNLDT